MQKREIRLFLALLGLVIAVSAVITGLARGQKVSVRADSIERRVTYDGVVFEIISAGDNKLCLRAISPKGSVIGYYPLPKAKERGMFTAYHTVGWLGSELYLYKYETNANTPERRGEAIEAYDMLSGKSRIVAEIPSPGGLDSFEVFCAQNTSGGGLFIGYLEHKSGILTVNRVDALGGETERAFSALVEFPLASISVAETGELFALSRDSCVYMLEDTSWICVFKPEPGEAAANMTVSEGDEVYLFTASSERTRVMVSTLENRLFSPLELNTDGFIKLHIADKDTFVALDGEFRYVVSAMGEIRTINRLKASFRVLWDLGSLMIIAVSALGFVGLFAAVRIIVLKRRLHLLQKLLIIIIPLFTVGMLSLISVAERNVEKLTENGQKEAILEYASESIADIDAVRFSEIDWNAPFEDEYYQQLLELSGKLSEYRMVGAYNGGELSAHNAFINCWIYRIDGNNVYTAVCGGSVTGLEIKYFEYTQEDSGRVLMMQTKEPVITRYGGSDSSLRWIAVLFPIIANGEPVGYLQAARPLTAIDKAVYDVKQEIIKAGVLSFTAVITALVVVLALSTRTLGRLKRGALAVSGGDYSARVKSISWDETGEIAAAFNKMAQSVERSITEITGVSNGYKRFVSDRLIELLGKQSISEIRPGDHTELMATHILLYNDNLDKLKDETFFEALGRLYDIVIPCIASGGGLISRYWQQGLAAMLDDSPETALRIVREVFTALDRAGCGGCHVFMSYSGATLGVTGNGENLNMITVSRLVNDACLVGTAGKVFGTRLMVPQSSYIKLGDLAGDYSSRFLGFLYDGGEKRRLYDFYNCDPAELRLKKNETRECFENGVRYYYSREYAKARRAFIEVLKQFPEDLASREFLRRSDEGHKTSGEPKGVIEL